MTALVLLLLLAGPKDKERIVPEKVVARTTPSFGTEYAVYTPRRTTRRKPLPLILHVVPFTTMTPYDCVGRDKPFTSYAAAVDRNCGIHCAIQLQAHNVENPQSNPNTDLKNYLRLIERDAKCLAEVMKEVGKVLPYDPDRVVLGGSIYAAEVALAVGLRNPDRITAIVLKDIGFISLARTGGGSDLKAIPESENAFGVPILLSRFKVDDGVSGEDNGETERDFMKYLLEKGFRIVERHSSGRHGFVTQEMVDWGFGQAEKRGARRAKARQRDALLAAAREQKQLSAALARYRQAVELERKHGLDEKSKELYTEREAKGRELLADPNQRANVVRLFKGLPLEEEAKD